jgi:hypothetical protein
MQPVELALQHAWSVLAMLLTVSFAPLALSLQADNASTPALLEVTLLQ